MNEADLMAVIAALLERGTKPTVPEVLPLVDAFYRMGNLTGGALHIVLDDGNVEDGSVDFCIDWAEKEKDKLGLALAKLVRLCSATQREKLYRQHALPVLEAYDRAYGTSISRRGGKDG